MRHVQWVAGAFALCVAALLTDAVLAQAQGDEAEVNASTSVSAGSTFLERQAAIDPDAVAALTRMGDFLRKQQTFVVRADVVTDEVLASGQRLQLTSTVELKVRRPDHLSAVMASDRKTRHLFYDGRTFTVYGPRTGYYATVDAPKTIAQLIVEVEDQYGVQFPLVDLFLWGTDESGVHAIKEATYVGPATIDGARTDHYAFRQSNVDWQIWIQKGDRPFPRKLIITTLDEEGEPQYAATLSWSTPKKLGAAWFKFVPDKKARPTVLAKRAEETVSPGTMRTAVNPSVNVNRNVDYDIDVDQGQDVVVNPPGPRSDGQL